MYSAFLKANAPIKARKKPKIIVHIFNRSLYLSITPACIANIYPNPAKEVLNIQIGNTNAAKVNLVVTDSYGKIVIEKAVNLYNAKGINYIQLGISNLPAGSYNVKLISGDGYENSVKKFVKQ